MDFPRPTKYVKFKGPFKELKKNGWTFQKVFGRNYRSYKKTCDGEVYGGTTLRIWQHLKGYLEIDDFFSYSYLIVDFIQSGDYQKGKEVGSFFDPEDVVYVGQLDKQTLQIYPGIPVIEPWIDNKNKEKLKEWHKRYRIIRLDDDDIREISDLLNREWIEIQVDKRPRR